MEIKKYIILSLIGSLGLISCEDYLEANPEMGIGKKEVYSEYDKYMSIVDNANFLVHNYCWDRYAFNFPVGVYSDEAQISKTSSGISSRGNQGNWLDQNSADMSFNCSLAEEPIEQMRGSKLDPAGQACKAIRITNNCISNIDLLKKFPENNALLTPEVCKSRILGQAYFLRAWHYFEIIRRFGPLQNMQVLFSAETDFDKQRPSFQKCADWIAEDCDSAFKYLPKKWETAELGRVTKLTALSLKATAYMYAASPLMNTQSEVFPSKQYPYGQDSYDEEYAKKGIEAYSKAIKELNTGEYRYELYNTENIKMNWLNDQSPISNEALLQPVPSDVCDGNMPSSGDIIGVLWYQTDFFTGGSWGEFSSPTNNSVQWFETANGFPVNDDFTSEDPAFDSKNPYDNRDPRLEMNVMCPGKPMYLNKPRSSRSPYTDDWWPGGKVYDYYATSGKILTGYFFSGKYKYIGWNKQDNSKKEFFRIFPLIRVADLYLGLAELANEVYGPKAAIPNAGGLTAKVNGATLPATTALECVNVIRTRAGMPDVRSEFTGSTQKFRERIRNEWAVEFYQEFRRWKDIRRWRIAKDIFSKPITGVTARKVSGGISCTPNQNIGATRVFEDRHYWYPFPTKTIQQLNKNFEQNPGWK